MSFGTLSEPDGLWWTVPFDGQPALKMFLPLEAIEHDEPVALLWQGTTQSDAVLQFVKMLEDILGVQDVRSLMDDPPRQLNPEELRKETSGPDSHFFVAINGRKGTLRLWGDGPRSTDGGLTPEVGIAIRSPDLQEGRLLEAISGLLQSSLRWRNVPLTEISSTLKALVSAQAHVYGQWVSNRQTT